MKHKRTYGGMAIAFAVILAGCSGCDKVVSSAVVKEKEVQTARETGTLHGNGEAEEVTKTQQKSVPEQVQAPDIYEDDFTDEVNAAQSEASETAANEKMKLHVIAEAPVEVPEVEAILLKQVTHSGGDPEQMEKWAEILCEGEVCSEKDQTGEAAAGIYQDGKVTVQGLPYVYSYVTIPEFGKTDELVLPNFYWNLNWDQLSDEADEPFGEDKELSGESGTEARKLAEELLDKLGLSDFRIFWESPEDMPGPRDGMFSSPGKFRSFRAERLVEGVPVTYVLSAMYPYAQEDIPMEGNDHTSETGNQWWEQEELYLAYISDKLETLAYFAPLQVEDYSDEELFLLPFEEIRQIFKNTIGIQMASENRSGLMDYNGSLFMYPQVNALEAELKITKVKLGYMRIAEAKEAENLLIPVWDFFGTWEAKVPGENGTIRQDTMDAENISLLTIDARDGSIIQRIRGR